MLSITPDTIFESSPQLNKYSLELIYYSQIHQPACWSASSHKDGQKGVLSNHIQCCFWFTREFEIGASEWSSMTNTAAWKQQGMLKTFLVIHCHFLCAVWWHVVRLLKPLNEVRIYLKILCHWSCKTQHSKASSKLTFTAPQWQGECFWLHTAHFTHTSHSTQSRKASSNIMLTAVCPLSALYIPGYPTVV